VENWLVSEMASFPGLDPATARRWLRERRVAALLDGLDEFNDERRAELAVLLNNGFLRDHPLIPVVICSRINEYAVLQSDEATKLVLGGAVELQPLTDDQVAEYLIAAKAEGLLAALPNDPSLRELARSPLTLSMLVLAYGGESPSAPATGTSLSETRFRLFESYVARMLQRQARRDQGVPFDTVAANDVPVGRYRFPPGRIDNWLGWLALTLSVRMRTTFSPRGLLRLLVTGNQPERQPLNYGIVYFVLGAVMTLALALAVLPILPLTAPGLLGAAAAIGAAWLLLPLAATADHEWSSGIVVIAGLAIIAFLLATTSLVRVLGIFLPDNISPFALVPLVMAAVLIVGQAMDRRWNPRFTKLAIASSLTIGALVLLHAHPELAQALPSWRGQRLTAETLGIVLAWLNFGLGFVRASDFRLFGDQLGAFAALIGSAILFSAAVWSVEEVSWWVAVAALAATAVIAIVISENGVLLVAASAPLVAAAGFWGGPPAVMMGLFIGALAALFIAELVGVPGRATLGQFLARWFGWLDEHVLSRIAWPLLSLLGRLPARREAFLAAAVDAFLLKPSQREYEFVHRLLRDYFALRKLLPRLSQGDPRRIDTIKALGYQGEAALDMLVELAEQGEPRIRAAALSGLSHIASPVSTERFERSANDVAPEVRDALISSLPRLSYDDQGRILASMRSLHQDIEVEALLTAFPTGGPYWMPPEQANESTNDKFRRIADAGRGAVLFVRRMGLSGVDQLLRILKQGSPALRAAAATYLGFLEDERILGELAAQLHHRDPQVRAAAAAALGQLGDTRAIERLEPVANDRSRTVRAAAAQALKMLRRRVGASSG
jgi:HEAT repeat protein